MANKIGVLALQGDFREHINSINKCGAEAIDVRLPEKLEKIDALIIPGGESTTINKLLIKYNFMDALDNFNEAGKPVFGTCAGMIMLAKKVIGEKFGLGYIDAVVRRNAYGRQIDSFEEYIDLKLDNYGQDKFKAIFIRAPKILEIGEGVKVLAKAGSEIVLARQKNILICSFHPELGNDIRIHRYFLNMANNLKKKREKENVRAF